jgi:predicted SAM-dependent methyltransferase
MDNHYYQLIDNNGEIIRPFKGTEITVMKDIFDITIRAIFREKVYITKQIEGHYQDPIKKQQRVNNQKELEEYLDKQNQQNQ